MFSGSLENSAPGINGSSNTTSIFKYGLFATKSGAVNRFTAALYATQEPALCAIKVRCRSDFPALGSAVIKTVKVLNENYYTKEGVNTASTFKDIRDNYKIAKIQNSIKSVIVSTKDINAFFVIDKEELPAELRFDMSLNIEALQIPGEAKIKNFFLQWN